MNDLVEVRIPTYKRAEYLDFALKSLLKQTHTNWKAIVYDDSLQMEGEPIVKSINDSRINYQPNAQQLGAARNIDQSFLKLEGSDFGCVLEDDHWFYPEFLNENLEVIKKKKAYIIVRNLDKWQITGNVRTKSEGTTLGGQFREGWIEPIQLHACLLFFKCPSNASLFWAKDIKSNLVVGDTINDANIQEYVRVFQINEKVYYAGKPLSVWSRVSAEGIRVQYNITGTKAMRAKQHIKKMLLQKHGKVILKVATESTRNSYDRSNLEFNILDIPYFQISPDFGVAKSLLIILRSILRVILFKNPLYKYDSNS